MPSKFAVALKALLDDTDFFTRDEWTDYCVVSDKIINQWLADDSLPTPRRLRMIVRALEERGGPKTIEPLAQFNELRSCPAKDISPIMGYAAANLESYLS